MDVIIAAIGILLAKFYIYSLYAGKLNQMFEQSHDRFRVSGFRMLVSLVLTGFHALIIAGISQFMTSSATESLVFSPVPFITAVAFAALGWYVVIQVFYTKEASPLMYRAIAIGTLISAVFAGITTFLSFLGLLSTVNFC